MQVRRIIDLRYHLVLARYRFDANQYTDTPCGKLIEALVGDDGATEIVAAAEDEVGRRQVDGMNVSTDDFDRIRRYTGEAQANGQARNKLFALFGGRGYYNVNFILFFYHDSVVYFRFLLYL